jgi:hypothetical protein
MRGETDGGDSLLRDMVDPGEVVKTEWVISF